MDVKEAPTASCRIGILHADGRVESIKCPLEGTTGHTLVLLDRFWQEEAKIAMLLGNGDLIKLGSELGEPHRPEEIGQDDPRYFKWSAFMKRDRDGLLSDAAMFQSKEEFFRRTACFAYLFEEGRWHGYNVAEGEKMPVPSFPEQWEGYFA
jgi:hypothetical protein